MTTEENLTQAARTLEDVRVLLRNTEESIVRCERLPKVTTDVLLKLNRFTLPPS